MPTSSGSPSNPAGPPWGITQGQQTDTLDLLVALYEFMRCQGSWFAKPSATSALTVDYLPTANYQTTMSSVDQLPVRVAGRYYHYFQAQGIAVTSGDVVTIKANLTGNPALGSGDMTAIHVYPEGSTTAQATITANGIYYTYGNFYYMQTSTAPGSNTGTTNIFLMSRPS